MSGAPRGRDEGAPGAVPGARPERVALEAAAVLLAVLGYLWLFRTYGFDLVDEGTQLAQIERAARGGRPYVDFETGYTPGYFALHATLWNATGADLLASRTLGVVLHAGTAALLYALARLWLGPLLALCLVAVDVAFLLPVSPRLGAPHNAPYPGWLAAPLALAAQALVASVAARRAPVDAERAAPDALLRLLAAGLAAGLAFSVKPNAGLLALGGVALALPFAWSVEVRGARALAVLLRGGAVAGAVVLLGGAALEPGYALALLLPVCLAAWRAAPATPSALVRALPSHGDERPLVDLACVALGFVAPVFLWLVPLAAELGVGRILRDVLLLDGGGVVRAYLLPLPLPGPAVAALCTGLGAAYVAGRAAGRDPRRAGLAAGALGGLGVLGAVLLAGDAPPRVVAEEAILWLGPLALVLGLVLPGAGRDARRDDALLVFAAVFALQLFPRPDLIHVAMGGPPLLLAAGVVVCRAAGVRPAGERPAGERDPGGADAPATRRVLAARAVALALLVVCAARAYPALRARLAEPMASLGLGPRAPLVVAAPYAEGQLWIGDAARAIAARSAPGDEVFYFPDLAGLGFLAGRPARTYYLYFVPGRPDAAGEERTIAELEERNPALAVTGEPRVAAFRGAAAYFAALAAYLDARYGAPATVGECTLRERRTAP